MPMLRTIERPTKATLRPYSCAASRICWMRCTWLAKLATMIRLLGVRRRPCRRTLRDVPLGRDEARDLGVRRVGEEQVDALLAQPGERVQVGEAAVQRELVHLEVAGVDHHAGGGADGDRQGVRDGVVDRDELAVERPDALAVALRHLEGVRADAVLLELGLDEGEGQLGADQRDVRLLAQEVGDGADVVLVAVGEDDALDVVEAVPDGREVRQDQVDAGLLLLGEEHAAVDDQQAAAVLEDGHVAADLAEAAERGDPQAALREAAAGGPSSGCG